MMSGITQPQIYVMVVNDRQEIVESISRYLSQFDNVAVVGTAHGLEDSLQRARELRPPTVLCDYSRLKPETLQRLSGLRAELPDACIIAMSYDEEQPDEVLQAGADQFISKFSLTQHLLPALEQCSARHHGQSGL
jgi:DNA-binding NarL/FixJ family response regulator